ncbi:MAG: hypothetical protein H0U59_07180 [Gemmatimonadaceae bacterium]|nr:hypothetical protein [Gemmatimonadaceae bacterium]
MANVLKRNDKRVNIILDSLREHPGIMRACTNAGIDRVTLWRWRQDDPELSVMLDSARDQGAEVLEDVLIERAIDHDTTALIFALKAYRRDKYGDKWVGELGGKDGGPIFVVLGEDTKGAP